MGNEIIENYITSSGIKGKATCAVREIACKVAQFYSTPEKQQNKSGIPTRDAKRALITLNLPDETRRELARRIDKYAAMVSGAKCDGSLMCEPACRVERSSVICRVRI